MEAGFALSEIGTTTPHPVRMYDALLGGKDNHAADRQAVGELYANAVRRGPEGGRVLVGYCLWSAGADRRL